MKTREQIGLLPFLVMGFIMVCFLLGANRNVFAAGGGFYLLVNCGGNLRWSGFYSTYFTALETGGIELEPITSNSPWGDFDEPLCFYSVWKCGEDSWLPVGALRFFDGVSCNNCSDTAHNTTLDVAFGSCSDCTQQKAALAITCGGDEFITNWDETVCTGDCIDPCAEKRQAKIQECGGKEENIDPNSKGADNCPDKCKANCEWVNAEFIFPDECNPEKNEGPPCEDEKCCQD